MRKRLLLLGLLPAISLAAGFDQSSWGKFEYDFEEKSWAEVETQLPPAPKLENLLPFFVSASTDNRFFVDSASLTLGEDGVVRYTLLIRSAGGANNITYEGMRCSSGEFKRYAFGRHDGSWGKARDAKWEDIRYKDINRQHHMLYDDFFCPHGISVKSATEAIDALKRGEHPGSKGIAW
ncbi:MAG: CNP1-like family protein [Sulfuricella denitrificans]|nr:CNP1-like family protein [Sulfuricella denitrificans]